MHIEALPYADELRSHADQINRLAEQRDWSDDTPVRLEISVVYTAIIIRKLWEHYETLLKDVNFNLDEPLQGLNEAGTEKQQTSLKFVNRIMHSTKIDTGRREDGIKFCSDYPGQMSISYDDLLTFLREAADACVNIHG